MQESGLDLQRQVDWQLRQSQRVDCELRRLAILVVQTETVGRSCFTLLRVEGLFADISFQLRMEIYFVRILVASLIKKMFFQSRQVLWSGDF